MKIICILNYKKTYHVVKIQIEVKSISKFLLPTLTKKKSYKSNVKKPISKSSRCP